VGGQSWILFAVALGFFCHSHIQGDCVAEAPNVFEGLFPQGYRRQERETDYSRQSRVSDLNMWSLLLRPVYTKVALCLPSCIKRNKLMISPCCLCMYLCVPLSAFGPINRFHDIGGRPSLVIFIIF
jgi:hypothetical protein